MIRGRTAHAVLITGPAGVGKTTLALDLAAGLLCSANEIELRPCGTCRSCRLAARAGHPDVHRLGPEGPGRQVIIGGPGAKARGVRDLVRDLALMPVEGGMRIAIIEAADRMNDDAQTALLKTLEEPPNGVALILCADAEEPLLPTIRSRCARIRLGPVDAESMAAVLADHDIDDPALAARLTRLAGGRPGVALAWAADPDAMRQRDELARTLLDLSLASPATRLAAMRDVMSRGSGLILAANPIPASGPEMARGAAVDDAATPDDADVDDRAGSSKASASDRRRAAEAVVAVWVDVARDILVARSGPTTAMRDPRLLEDARAVGAELDDAALPVFLDRLGRAQVLLSANVAPGLVLDDLALAWPRRAQPAA
jgi:DNA polymerase III delta' subunit